MDQFQSALDETSLPYRKHNKRIEARAARKNHPLNAIRKRRLALTSIVCFSIATLLAPPALAHTSERAFVLLLPTGYYLLGGSLAVAATFLALRFVRPAIIARLFDGRISIADLRLPNANPFGLAMFGITAIMLFLGWSGPRDPLENALSTGFWTFWWVGLTLAHALFGNLWGLINPLRGGNWLIEKGTARLWPIPRKFLVYPNWLGYWPAIIGFFCFAWFELVFPAPDDPDLLANAVLLYLAINLLAMRIFGPDPWLARGESMSVFFRLVSGLSPIRVARNIGKTGNAQIQFVMPGASLIADSPHRLDYALFVLLVLSSVSFDGLSRTFWWLDLAGVNPLEYPGRTMMLAWNSIGLVATFGVLAVMYFVVEKLGQTIAHSSVPGVVHATVVSLAPISLGFHGAHYLTSFLVNAQYALNAFADPFALGWNLLGLGDHYVTTSFLSNQPDVLLIWNLQAIAIVLGHVLAVIMAQAISSSDERRCEANWVAQAPLATLMVFYTLFGLWLLSTPVAG